MKKTMTNKRLWITPTGLRLIRTKIITKLYQQGYSLSQISAILSPVDPSGISRIIRFGSNRKNVEKRR